MKAAITLKGVDVPRVLKAGYAGRKFKLNILREFDVPVDANLWSGGSRETYRAIRLIDGAEIKLGSTSAPWSRDREEKRILIEPGIVIVQHSYDCGKDMGLTFFVHPDNVVKFLPSYQAAA
jgi:hypothetical protein